MFTGRGGGAWPLVPPWICYCVNDVDVNSYFCKGKLACHNDSMQHMAGL